MFFAKKKFFKVKKFFFKSFSGMPRRHQIQKKKENRVDFRPVRVLDITVKLKIYMGFWQKPIILIDML